MATEQYEPLNVQIDEESGGCCSSTRYYVLRYPMNGKDSPSWDIVPFNGEYRIEFRATGYGKTYGHRSQAFPLDVKRLIEQNRKRSTREDYEVRIEKSSSFDLRRYF